ncbi:MAG: CARDB domain-containing protein, partial [bacterium]
AYLDTLVIFNSDVDNPQVPVILIGSGSNQFPPRITSADTVTATEDVFFEYTATAIDSDGTLPQFLFRDLPVWLATKRVAADNNVVEGTPREGDRDTSFVVVATDGLFSDTLSVYVRVLPVNDPPVISPIADQFGVEQTLLTFNLSAFDPEDSTLAFTAQGLPAGAIFTDNGDKTASFTWTPPVGSAGVYAVTFIVTEVVAQNALSDTATVQITIKENLPDLVASLQITDSNISLNQTRLLTGTVRDEVAPVDTSFRLTFFYDGNFVKDTVITKMSVGQEVSFPYLALFDRLGTHEITFAVDWNKEIAESNEGNNNIFLRLQVTKGDLVVRPNPFTPNNDGFNDRVRFDFGRLVLNQPRLKIFDFNGVLLRTIEQPQNRQFLWDGLDAKGHEQKPGVYLYILTDRHNRISSGYVVLAR